MKQITLGQLVTAVNGTLVGRFTDLDQIITDVDTDSRNIKRGSVFFPLVGDKFDGHHYITSALARGSVGCLISTEQEQYDPNKFYVMVDDTQKALGHLAAWYRSLFQLPVIAVTGSVGKTTTKDMLAATLATRYEVHKTQGNFNNTIGLPLTLLGLSDEHQICVVELGMDTAGEIDYLANIAKPNIGIITNIGDAHIERLGSHENILAAKSELLPHIPKDGLLLLNGDDIRLVAMKKPYEYQTYFVGQGIGLDYRAEETDSSDINSISFQVTTPEKQCKVDIPALGIHMMYPAMFSIAISERFHLSTTDIIRGIGNFVPSKMRMGMTSLPLSITVFDDTYNANPQSMRAALAILADHYASRKIAILGDMLELGPISPALHRGVGEELNKDKINCVVTVGELAKHIAEGAKKAGIAEVYSFETKTDAIQAVKSLVEANTTILLKASRGMALEEISEAIIEFVKQKYT